MLPYDYESQSRHIFTVSELTSKIKNLLEESFPSVWVEGEISNCRMPSSGHIYFTLKDEQSQLNAVFFRGANQKTKFKIEDGLKVLALGNISVYQRRGDYQLIVGLLQPRGIGEFQLAFEQLKRKLQKEGLFAPEHKKPIPLFPRRIGIVTSPTGAAIRDILNVINRRFRQVEILINPVKVQGEGAGGEIAEAIDEFNEMGDMDVLIVGRGGGSMEDLWAFNEEIVARAIYNSKVPVISAVGHEIDFVISDFVADLRAPTPSAAAELVVGEMEQITQKIGDFQTRITAALTNNLSLKKEKLFSLLSSYALRHPEERLFQYKQEIDDFSERMERTCSHILELAIQRTSNLSGKLNMLSPLATLSRGYSYTLKLPQRTLITDTRRVKPHDKVEVKLAKGAMICEVEKTKN
ncbi:MAG: exodeoxyribonuclease VII large subunit [bacterium]|nr:exodeoxyribonuclease VII large subunit [bacterium]